MPKGDGAFLGGMFFLSALAFVLPFLRTVKFFGIALFGWWMAALMFFCPLVIAYLIGCIAIGLYFARQGLSSEADYWVAGRKVGVAANSMAIMASLASGGSIIGVMGLAYAYGIPYTLSLFAGAVLGFPMAAILVAGPLRKFGCFTLSDFLSFRYPHWARRDAGGDMDGRSAPGLQCGGHSRHAGK